jgi:hypothetical protein
MLRATQDKRSFEQALGIFVGALFGPRALPGSLLSDQIGQRQSGVGKIRDILLQPSSDAEKGSEVLLRSGLEICKMVCTCSGLALL